MLDPSGSKYNATAHAVDEPIVQANSLMPLSGTVAKPTLRQDDGSRLGPPGVSIYRPSCRNRPTAKWMIAYKEGGRRIVKSVSPDLEETRRVAHEMSRTLDGIPLEPGQPSVDAPATFPMVRISKPARRSGARDPWMISYRSLKGHRVVRTISPDLEKARAVAAKISDRLQGIPPAPTVPAPLVIPGVSIYKPACRSSPQHSWIVAWTENGKRRSKSVSPNLALTQQFAMKMSERVERIRLGLVSARDDRFIEQERRPLQEHLDDYAAVLAARGVTASHVATVRNMVGQITQAANIHRASSILPSSVQRAVDGLKAQKGQDRPASAWTRNHYLAAILAFCNWMKEDGRIAHNPLEGTIHRYRPKSDRRHVRRIITEEELHRLLAAADAGPVFVPPCQKDHAIAGKTRGDIYRLALATGLRANEIRTLSVGDLRLDESTPGVCVESRYAKNRREAFQIIGPSIAAMLQVYADGKSSDARVFRMPQRAAEMLQFDLAAAGIAYQDADGRCFDFHSLRYQAGSMLVRRGVNLKVVQNFMRHSDINLTLGTYVQPQLHDQRGASAALEAAITGRSGDSSPALQITKAG